MNRVEKAFNALGGAFMVRMGWVANLGTTGARTGRPRTALDGADREAALAELVASMPRSFRGATWTGVFVLAPATGSEAAGGTAGGDVGVEGPSS